MDKAGKKNIRLIRLNDQEIAKIDEFLKLNPFFENFSALVRVAILDFVSKDSMMIVSKVSPEKKEGSKEFLWDYDLSFAQIKEILNGPQNKRLWLVARILEHARFEEIWKYLTVEQVKKDISKLRMMEKTKKVWIYALNRWEKK